MEYIRLFDTVTEKGLNLNVNELKKFMNQKVKIVISAIDENEERKDRLRQLAGCLKDEDAKDILDAIKDCKNIDFEVWDEVFT